MSICSDEYLDPTPSDRPKRPAFSRIRFRTPRHGSRLHGFLSDEVFDTREVSFANIPNHSIIKTNVITSTPTNFNDFHMLFDKYMNVNAGWNSIPRRNPNREKNIPTMRNNTDNEQTRKNNILLMLPRFWPIANIHPSVYIKPRNKTCQRCNLFIVSLFY